MAFTASEQGRRNRHSRGVVEYDISSGTRADHVREFKLPGKYGYTGNRGGVTVLDNNTRWLIAWGQTYGGSVPTGETIAVSEVDPDTGTAHFHMHMSKSHKPAQSYRVYREPEASVRIPLNLP